MKVYISADIEGIWGVVSTKQTGGENEDYSRARKLMTAEVNMVCTELFKNGATEIVVNDAHGSMDNILINDLHPDVSLISGSPKDLDMMEGIDSTFDCALLIGYHPRAGTSQGIFDHTYSGRIVLKLKVNDQLIGESGLSAIIAGHFDVPVVLVAGDDKVTENVKTEIGDIETVTVKYALSRYCARNVPFNVLQERYSEAVGRAVANLKKYPIKKPDRPLTVTLQFARAIMADVAVSLPEVKKTDSSTVEFSAADPVQMSRLFRSVITLAASALDS